MALACSVPSATRTSRSSSPILSAVVSTSDLFLLQDFLLLVLLDRHRLTFQKHQSSVSSLPVESSACYARFCSRLRELRGKGHGHLLPCKPSTLPLSSYSLSLAHARSCTHWASSRLIVGPRASPPSVLPGLTLQCESLLPQGRRALCGSAVLCWNHTVDGSDRGLGCWV